MRLTALLPFALLAVSTPALAEDPYPAGGVVFKELGYVSILEEHVYLSAREVRVSYRFEASESTPDLVTMGFKLPVVPLDGGPEYLGGIVEELPDYSNYLQVEITANGKPVALTSSGYAFLNGFDVTDQLEAAGVPVFLPQEAIAEALIKVDQEAMQRLVAQGFFYTGSSDDVTSWEPGWSYQTVYEWEQAFAPGEVLEMEVRYVPLNGYYADIGTAYEGGDPQGEDAEQSLYIEPTIRAEYCIDDGLIKALKKRREAGDTYEVVVNGFDLKAPGNLYIDKFSLTVDKADPAMGGTFAYVAFCPTGAEKISDTAFRWSVDNFTPMRDVSVVYYSFYEIPE